MQRALRRAAPLARYPPAAPAAPRACFRPCHSSSLAPEIKQNEPFRRGFAASQDRLFSRDDGFILTPQQKSLVEREKRLLQSLIETVQGYSHSVSEGGREGESSVIFLDDEDVRLLVDGEKVLLNS
jgi:hypothetical protein